MANAKKCDRCGTFYEKNSQRIVAVKSLDQSGGWIDYKDLCDDCADDFKRFLSGAKVEAEEKD